MSAVLVTPFSRAVCSRVPMVQRSTCSSGQVALLDQGAGGVGGYRRRRPAAPPPAAGSARWRGTAPWCCRGWQAAGRTPAPGTGVRPAIRVMITVWLTSGRVYSAAAPRRRRRSWKRQAPHRSRCPAGPARPSARGWRRRGRDRPCAAAPPEGPPRAAGTITSQHLFQRHAGAVLDGAAGLCIVQQGRVDQGAGVDDHVGVLQQADARRVMRSAAPLPAPQNEPWRSTP